MTNNESKFQTTSESSFPSDKKDTSELLSAICDDFSAKLRAGERVSVEDYVLAYPQHETDIRTAISALQLMNAVASQEVTRSTKPPIPNRIGRFQIVRRLGVGAMGIVYEATHPTVSRRIAIKVLKAETRAATGFRERFLREAEAASRLNHPNIVPFFDYGEDGSVAYMSMMYVDGISLDQLLNRHYMAEPGESIVGRDFVQMARIGADVAGALAHAHAQHTIHRDIKPANLLLDGKGKVWVTDFGLAKLRDDDDDSLSTNGQMIGTPRYMAPEQLRGIAEERSDIYSLGITLLELVSGSPVWAKGDTSAETGMIDASAVLRSNSLVPPELARIISKACAPAPNKRYSKASDLQFALNQFAHGGGKTDRRGESRSDAKGKFRDIVLGIGLMLGLTLAAILGSPKSKTETAADASSVEQTQPDLKPELSLTAPASVSIVDGMTDITDVLLTGSDPNGDPFSWQLEESPDSDAFIVQALSGHLCLKKPAQHSSPADADHNNIFDLSLTASDSAQPHVAVFTVDRTSGDILITEPAVATSRRCQLPSRLLCICTSVGQTFLHAHLSKDGTVALYESDIEPDSSKPTTRLLQSNCKLSPFIRGLAQGPDSAFLTIIQTRAGFELQWLRLNKDHSFEATGQALPIEAANPVGLSSLGDNDFQLLESLDNGSIVISELAVTGTRIVGRRELPAGWRSRERVLGMAAWQQTAASLGRTTERQEVRIKVIPQTTD